MSSSSPAKNKRYRLLPFLPNWGLASCCRLPSRHSIRTETTFRPTSTGTFGWVRKRAVVFRSQSFSSVSNHWLTTFEFLNASYWHVKKKKMLLEISFNFTISSSLSWPCCGFFVSFFLTFLLQHRKKDSERLKIEIKWTVRNNYFLLISWRVVLPQPVTSCCFIKLQKLLFSFWNRISEGRRRNAYSNWSLVIILALGRMGHKSLELFQVQLTSSQTT